MQTIRTDATEALVNRSFLFVPADSDKKLQKAQSVAADALIIDLEDSVADSTKPVARERARDFLQGEVSTEVWVRINPLDTEDALLDLRTVMPTAPAGIVLPKPNGARDAIQLAKLLDVLEHESGSEPGQTAILPIATERPSALFHLHEYASVPRLA